MSDIDDLENMMVNGSASGATPKVAASVSGLDVALEGKPHDLQTRILKIVAGRNLDQNDPAVDLFAAAGISADAAAATGAAALEVKESVGKIQSQIFNGAIKAGAEISGQMSQAIEAKLTEGGQALVAAITIAADAGSAKIKAGALDLTLKLDQAIEMKKAEGVDAFAKAAATAAGKAALAGATKRFMWSVTGVAINLLIFAGIGALIDHEYLSLTHRIAPSPIVQFNGKNLCGVVKLGGVRQEMCRIQ
ncbi:hypothetical protein BBC27_05810 [Acidithiobacillus ferrivorans]|uniref:Uncharacterized protein n=1 Tax=Acidithiobacillus ferrivorans TaxID=160808 RepID=A0A1B9C212_9PROT|nr:hypothetical protein [Acidithiobacillus ferrivorans]OCB03910.1 hypothetical protein BBC27_05810 [Acidithiobacillus ferrivorans]